MSQRAFLFLQGPISPFFAEIATALADHGHAVHRINLCVGDLLFWQRPGAVNYRGRLSDWPAWIANFLDTHRITDIVLLGEQRDYHWHAIMAAKKRGIQVTVTDFGYLRPDYITLEHDGMTGWSRFPRDPDAIRALAAKAPKADPERRFEDSFWAMAVWDMIYHLANYFLWFLFPRYITHKLENPILIYLGTGKRRLLMQRFNNRKVARVMEDFLNRKVPYFVFPLQMENDFQIRAYSDFPDLATPIEMIIASFARQAPADTHLLVKVHPLDPGLKNWGDLVERYANRYAVADRVHYVDGGNLDQMCKTARGMVTINSTSGLAALRLDCPVKTLGQAIFDVPGLTHQGPLDTFWSAPQAPDPDLRNAFIDAMSATILIRGVFYRRPGLDNGVREAVHRLHHNLVNQIIGEPPLPAGSGLSEPKPEPKPEPAPL